MCGCVWLCWIYVVSQDRLLGQGFIYWPVFGVCSGNTAATDHYTTLIMLSVNSGCKYPRERIGPTGKHAHIKETHTDTQTRQVTNSVLHIQSFSRRKSQSISAIWLMCVINMSVEVQCASYLQSERLGQRNGGGGWGWGRNQTLLQRISTRKRVRQMDTQWLRKGEEGRHGNKTIQSLNKGVASQGRLQAELLCHRFNIYHTRKRSTH